MKGKKEDEDTVVAELEEHEEERKRVGRPAEREGDEFVKGEDKWFFRDVEEEENPWKFGF